MHFQQWDCNKQLCKQLLYTSNYYMQTTMQITKKDNNNCDSRDKIRSTIRPKLNTMFPTLGMPLGIEQRIIENESLKKWVIQKM